MKSIFISLGTYHYNNDSKYTGDWHDDNMSGYVRRFKNISLRFLFRGPTPGKTEGHTPAPLRTIQWTGMECTLSLTETITMGSMFKENDTDMAGTKRRRMMRENSASGKMAN